MFCMELKLGCKLWFIRPALLFINFCFCRFTPITFHSYCVHCITVIYWIFKLNMKKKTFFNLQASLTRGCEKEAYTFFSGGVNQRPFGRLLFENTPVAVDRSELPFKIIYHRCFGVLHIGPYVSQEYLKYANRNVASASC